MSFVYVVVMFITSDEICARDITFWRNSVVLAAPGKSRNATLAFNISGVFAPISFKLGGCIKSSIGNVMKLQSFQ
jgi:hypothetical protein